MALSINEVKFVFPGNTGISTDSCLTVRILFWPGDVNSIRVGSRSNIQDNSLLHVAKSNLSGKVLPTIIGDNVTIGK